MGVGVRVGGRECRRDCGLFRERHGPGLRRLVGTLVARLPRGQPLASLMSRRRLVRTFVLWSIPPISRHSHPKGGRAVPTDEPHSPNQPYYTDR